MKGIYGELYGELYYCTIIFFVYKQARARGSGPHFSLTCSIMAGLNEDQRHALSQLRELTNGGDDEAAINVLESVGWDVQVGPKPLRSFSLGSPCLAALPIAIASCQSHIRERRRRSGTSEPTRFLPTTHRPRNPV